MHPIRQSTRMTELRAIIDAYRTLSIDEAEATDAGDREAEAVAELWRLEQAAMDRPHGPARTPHAA